MSHFAAVDGSEFAEELANRDRCPNGHFQEYDQDRRLKASIRNLSFFNTDTATRKTQAMASRRRSESVWRSIKEAIPKIGGLIPTRCPEIGGSIIQPHKLIAHLQVHELMVRENPRACN